jgi:diacylglycerol kinase family enzyme
LAAKAIQDGYDKFISVGGDGTHHEVVNGLLRKPKPDLIPTLAIANAGTGNDWSRMHKIQNDNAAWVQMILRGNTILHSAGKITYTLDGETRERFYMNVAGMALDGRVMEKFPPVLKRIPFLPGYLIAGLQQLFIYKAPNIRIEYDGDIKEGRYVTVHAGISRYSGNGMQFVPHADPSGDEIAVTGIQKMSTLRLLMNLPRVFIGTLLSHPKVDSIKCKVLKISSKESVPIEADGEFLGYAPVTIEIMPKVFRLVRNF